MHRWVRERERGREREREREHSQQNDEQYLYWEQILFCQSDFYLSLTASLFHQRDLRSALRPLQEKLKTLNTAKQNCDCTADHIKVG